ncbi:MAG: ChaB family protein [Candidatus Amoebophilus sp.]|uniref:Cation transport regulator ChaB n=1 Tax=Amoebophilus asiaticus (strain 5a2) TaxID=452471 RepID=B3ER81_AMOA5|nr:ChaB family protein [Candidatus Amoebophilus asiaticus]ACE05733.1 hypothetical protein Aasi_0295 [Candidatus Amoebophilus asiaticus 5a2]
MPYKHNSELPKNVTNNLPEHAQDIYRAAFNHAWEEYEDPSKRREGSSREEVARRVAWSAVEKKYKKSADGTWVEKSNK